MYQKYIIKVKNKSVIANQDVVINNLSQNPDLLKIERSDSKLFAELGMCKLPIEIIYMGNDEKFPTITIKVSSNSVDELESFEKVFNNIVRTDNRFSRVNCTFDGISEYYSSSIYAKLHRIERKGRELLKEMFYVADDSEDLKTYGNSVDEIDKDFTFGNLIDAIFKKEDKKNVELIEYIHECVLKKKVPEDKILPKTIWEQLIFKLTKDRDLTSKDTEIELLLSKIKKARNSVAHCNKFLKTQYDSTIEDIEQLESQFDNIIEAIKLGSISVKDFSAELRGANSEILSTQSDVVKQYIDAYGVFEQDLLGQVQGSIIKWDKVPEEYKLHHDFYENIREKTDSEIIVETEKLEKININLGIPDSQDDLTIIVPAQEEGFQQVFLRDHEWYDIRIGKARRNKIKYIAGYEVAPRSGIQYIAKVKEIVPSDNYLGYWKVVFDGEPEKYDQLIRLGDTYPPQNIRYTTKHELDEVAKNKEKLEKIFNNPY